jgi:hypothetical protein
MQQQSSGMGSGLTGEFGDNLSYMFKDPAWVMKFVLGSILGIVPILNFVVAGYMVEVIRNIRKDTAPVMPEWGPNFGKFFMDGLFVAIAGLIYGIIPGIIGGIGGAVMGLGSGDNGAANAIFLLIGGVILLVVLVLAIGLIFWMQAAMVNFAVDGSFGSLFAFGKIWSIVTGNIMRLVYTVVIVVVAGILISIIALIPCLGWIIGLASSFYVGLAAAYNMGFVARKV